MKRSPTSATGRRSSSAASGSAGSRRSRSRRSVEKGVARADGRSRTTAASTTSGSGSCSRNRQIRKMISSYVGENKDLRAAVPLRRARGRARAAGDARGADARGAAPGSRRSTRRPGVGTPVAEGKETREFDGRSYLLERALGGDFALVKAWRATRSGTSSTATPRATSTRSRRWPAEGHDRRGRGARRASASSTPTRSTRRGSSCSGSSRARTYEKRIERRTVSEAVSADARSGSSRARRGARGGDVRQPRHRPADAAR